MSINNIAAIIITYHPDLAHLAIMIECLKKQVNSIIVVDNTPSNKTGDEFFDNVYYLNLGSNLGIAKAQNIGIEKAFDLSCVRCLLLDQDSTIPKDLVSVLDNDMSKLERKNIRVACIGPRIIDSLENKVERSADESASILNCTETKQIIASGSLINLASIHSIGFMEDKLFIDAVDHEWCWRALAKGYHIYISENVFMSHIIGLERGNVFSIKYIVCSPIRHYYQFRNTLWLLPRRYVPLKWKVKKLLEILIMPFIFAFKGPDRKERLKFMCKGIRDGLFNRV